MSVMPWYSKPEAIWNTWPWLNIGEYLVEIQTGTLTSVNIAGELFTTFPAGMVSRKLQIVSGAVVNLGGIVAP